jgi:hypothetical protein
MKYISIILVACLMSLCATAQQREKIKKLTIEEFDQAYYKKQAELWKAYVQQHKKDEDAWYNYFLASRYSLRDSGKPYTDTKKEMVKLHEDMQAAIPNSFTYNFTKGWQMGCWDKGAIDYFLKADKIRPNHPQVVYEIMFPLEVFGPKEMRNEYMNKYFNTQTESPELLTANYNMLASLDENAIIFTIGDNDTYPLWLLQEVKGFRKDVLVLNKGMMGIDEYRERLFKEGNIVLPKEVADSLRYGEEEYPSDEKKSAIQNQLVQVLAKYSKRPVYISNTVGEDDALRKNIKDKLYITGLAALYSETRVDNVAIIKRHYENDYLLDYLLVKFRKDEKPIVSKNFDYGYISPFITLYFHFTESGETDKAKRIKKYLDAIAIDLKMEKEMEGYLSKAK